MSGIDTNSNSLDASMKRLAQSWQDIKTVWHDPVRWRFEKEYWTPLETQVTSALREMENLAKVIAQARRNIK